MAVLRFMSNIVDCPEAGCYPSRMPDLTLLKIDFFSICFYQDFFLFIRLVTELLTPNLCPGTLSYEN